MESISVICKKGKGAVIIVKPDGTVEQCEKGIFFRTGNIPLTEEKGVLSLSEYIVGLDADELGKVYAIISKIIEQSEETSKYSIVSEGEIDDLPGDIKEHIEEMSKQCEDLISKKTGKSTVNNNNKNSKEEDGKEKQINNMMNKFKDYLN